MGKPPYIRRSVNCW